MNKILVLTIVLFILYCTPYVKAAEQIFFDDFESGVENWDLEQGWAVILEDGNRVLQGNKHTFATVYLDGTVNKLKLKLKLLQGTIHLNIRAKSTPNGFNRYFIGLEKDCSYIEKQIGDNFQHLKDGKGISLNKWHNIKIEIVGNRINVFSDGSLIIWAQDDDFLQEGGVSFETLDNSIAYIDDVQIEMSVPEAKELKAQHVFPNGVHKGDLILREREFLVLEGSEFEQFGNIYLKDSSKLIIRNSTLQITRYQRLLNHWGIHLRDKASLEIVNSKLLPGKETLFVIEAQDRARVYMKNSPTKIHLFEIGGNSKALVENSEIVSEIGGLIGAYDRADLRIVNSKVGAVNLYIPNGAEFKANGLGTGFFKKWNLHENTTVSGINYNITLINTELIKDNIGPGPFERGWPVFIDSGAKVEIKNSELRKVVVELYDEKAEFRDLLIERPVDFNYRNISLENVIVKGQWGIFLHGQSDVTVSDSEAFWTFIYDNSKLKLVNTHMNEFDPRNFHGEIVFENCYWDTAAEIIENNDFTMKGTLEIGEIGGFSWENSSVTRFYDVIWKPNTELTLKKGGKTVWQGKTNEDGKTSFSIKFNDTNFFDSWELEDEFGAKLKVDFFSATPIWDKIVAKQMLTKRLKQLKFQYLEQLLQSLP